MDEWQVRGETTGALAGFPANGGAGGAYVADSTVPREKVPVTDPDLHARLQSLVTGALHGG